MIYHQIWMVYLYIYIYRFIRVDLSYPSRTDPVLASHCGAAIAGQAAHCAGRISWQESSAAVRKWLLVWAPRALHRRAQAAGALQL